MARPLAASPLHRPAAGGRPGRAGMQSAQMRRGGTRAHGARPAQVSQVREPVPMPRQRIHADPTGGYPRPQRQAPNHRQAQVSRPTNVQAEMLRRRRTNMLMMLLLATGSTLFLAATTKEPAMGYVFAASFLVLCGYLYLLSQVRQREATSWPSDWMHAR